MARRIAAFAVLAAAPHSVGAFAPQVRSFAPPRHGNIIIPPPPSLVVLSSTPESSIPAAVDLPVEKNQPSNWADGLQRMEANAVINYLVMLTTLVSVGAGLYHMDASIPHKGVATLQDVLQRVPLEAWDSYSDVLDQAPIATKACTSATVYTIGDVISQRTEGTNVGNLDRGRILRSLIAGGIGHGPLSHFWYYLCDDLFANVLHITQWWAPLAKVGVDQLSWGPFWNNTYILLLGLMKMDSFGTIWSDVKRTTIPLIANGLRLWVPAHLITYGLIPVENRLLWVDLVEIAWVTILATQAAAKATPTEESEA